jgi:diacylglycerol kinase family enzyme
MLGILPIGTFNNIARSIGMPANLPAAANIIVTGHE